MISHWRVGVFALLTSFLIMIPLGEVLVLLGVPWGLRVATFCLIGAVIGFREGVRSKR